MTINPDDVSQLRRTGVNQGDRWVYVADFNIKHNGIELKSTDRVDAEADDARYILEQGGIVLFLAHKGRFKDGDTEDLDFIASHLGANLGVPVVYHPENTTPAAFEFVRRLQPGTAAIMGNTRKHEGEEKNDPELAAQFARLGQYVAVGGFGKSHRDHASNIGILTHLPGYATESQLVEMVTLNPWAGFNPEVYSVAVLGGIKKEKITTGLVGFAAAYDAVIPGGIVLNTILKVRGYNVGASRVKDGGKTFEKEVGQVLDGPYSAKVIVPERVVVARIDGDNYVDAGTINIGDGVPDGYMIVDYVMPATALASLDKVVESGGRLILAGTPGIYKSETGELLFTEATDSILERMRASKDNCIVLGGDTAGEVGYDGPTSTGGGSALYFAVHGTTPVFEALKVNKQRLHK